FASVARPRSRRAALIKWSQLKGLFRRLEHRRRSSAKLFAQRRLVGPGSREMPLLHMPETTDFLRDRGKPDRHVVIVGVEAGENFSQRRLVIAHKLPLGAALGCVSKRIERRTTQKLHFRKNAESRKNPRPERHLLRDARALVAARKQRRREMDDET